MLTQVAPEATIVPHGDHYYCVKYKGKTFPNLPKGEHGKGPRAEIKVGKVKSMVRLLGIDETKAYEFLGLVVKEKPSARLYLQRTRLDQVKSKKYSNRVLAHYPACALLDRVQRAGLGSRRTSERSRC